MKSDNPWEEQDGNHTAGADRLRNVLYMEQYMDRNRTLTDADIEALLVAAEKKFYLNLGKGVWGVAWKVILGIVIAIAAYGHYNK